LSATWVSASFAWLASSVEGEADEEDVVPLLGTSLELEEAELFAGEVELALDDDVELFCESLLPVASAMVDLAKVVARRRSDACGVH
jgi:hypothetical protein